MAVGVTVGLSFRQLAVISHDPSVFCTGQIGEFREIGRGLYPCIIQVFEAGINFCNSFREVILFWLTVLW